LRVSRLTYLQFLIQEVGTDVMVRPAGLTSVQGLSVSGALESVGAQAYCRRAAEERRERALRELAGAELKQGPAAELRQIADFLLERDY
jgi:geranylgeranyl pyrophosphate synthase